MSELTGLYALWYREVKVFTREKSRVISSLITPILWIVIFGGGLGSAVDIHNVNYQVFIFPGILVMSVLFSSIFFGLYIVWDKKIDFFKEVLVAPLRRPTIFAGKMLGGCTDAILQGLMILLFGVFLGVTYTPITVGLALLFMLGLAAGAVSIGLIIGSLLESIEGFQLIVSFINFPLFFFSGALFPLDNLQPWMCIFTFLDPVTYAVDGLRGVIIGVSQFPLYLDLGVLMAFAITMILLGSLSFRRLR